MQKGYSVATTVVVVLLVSCHTFRLSLQLLKAPHLWMVVITVTTLLPLCPGWPLIGWGTCGTEQPDFGSV